MHTKYEVQKDYLCYHFDNDCTTLNNLLIATFLNELKGFFDKALKKKYENACHEKRKQ